MDLGKGDLVPSELIDGFFNSVMVLVMILFVVSLPMAFLVGKKKYGCALLYLPVYLLAMGLAAQNSFGT